jgi:hypothetical protein
VEKGGEMAKKADAAHLITLSTSTAYSSIVVLGSGVFSRVPTSTELCGRVAVLTKAAFLEWGTREPTGIQADGSRVEREATRRSERFL